MYTKRGIMKHHSYIAFLLMLTCSIALGQVASHAPTGVTPPTAKAQMPSSAAGNMMSVVVYDKPVVKVNGVALTDRDLVREMYAIFPYAQQHSGFPKGLEPEIRKGALEMIIFEELVYQEAERRKIVISDERMKRAEAEFRKQFSSKKEFDQYVQMELKGSQQLLRKRVRRSLLIETLLKSEVADKSKISLAEVRAYYQKNAKQYEYPETFSIQTISIMPPQNPTAEVRKEAKKRAEDALKKAKATKTYKEFGLLAEKVSDDDWHVNMGDRKQVDRAALPPPVVEAALKMKPGDVSDLMQFGEYYTLFRLNAHTPAGKKKFDEVKDGLRKDMEKTRYNELRTQLNKKLQQNAKVEQL